MAETHIPLFWDGGQGLVDRAGGIEARGTAPGTYKNSGDLDIMSRELKRVGNIPLAEPTEKGRRRHHDGAAEHCGA